MNTARQVRIVSFAIRTASIFVLRFNDCGDRAEELLVVRRHARSHIRKNSRRIVRAVSGRDLAAKQQRCALLDRCQHLLVQGIAEIVPRLRADVGPPTSGSPIFFAFMSPTNRA